MSLAGYSNYLGKFREAIFRCRVFHFNWEIGTSGRKIARVKAYIKFMLKMSVLRMFCKKIVFTLHNSMSYLNPESYSMILYMLKHSGKVIIHCSESMHVIKAAVPDFDENRIIYMPHPNYISSYPDTIHYSNYVKKPGEILLLALGYTSPYKNIHILIRAANQLKDITDLHFLICGSDMFSKGYQEQLLSLIEGRNITTDFRFIEDGEVPSLLELSDVLMTPYNTSTALNSGAANLAFSFGRTVIGTWTGTTRDVDESLVYCYDYTDNEEEHVSRLKDAIMKFYKDFKRDKASVKAKGEKLREIMQTEHSLEKVAEGLSEAYA